ncbi:hypothetical protein D3C83_05270 [compost metagenome]
MDLGFMAVHAAGREQSQDMQRVPGAARGLHRFQQHRVAEEFSGLDRVLDPRVILVDNAAGADVHVPDF